MKIHKYAIPVQGQFTLSSPKLSHVLCVQVQRNIPHIWVLLYPNVEQEDRTFRIYGTGHDIDTEPGRYVGTFQMDGGALIWHLFEA